MKIQELIEAVGDNLLYHSVREGRVAQQILKSGVIKPFVGDVDSEYGQEQEVISTSRDQYHRFPYGDGIVQFVLDKNALKQAGYKVEPWSMAQQIGGAFYKSEKEERVWHPKGIGIPVKAPFVKEIQVDPEVEAAKPFIKAAKKLGIPVTAMKGYKKSSNVDHKNHLDPNMADPSKYSLEKQMWFGEPAYTITYDKKDIIQPFYLVKDEPYIKKAFKQIVDRVKQGKGYEDIKKANIKYAKSWEKGRYELPVGSH